MNYEQVNQFMAYWGEYFKVPPLALDQHQQPQTSSLLKIESAKHYFNYPFNQENDDEALALALCFIDYARQTNPRLQAATLGDWSEHYQYSALEESNPFYQPLVKQGIIKKFNDSSKAWVGLG